MIQGDRKQARWPLRAPTLSLAELGVWGGQRPRVGGAECQRRGIQGWGCRESSGPGLSADLCVHVKSSLVLSERPWEAVGRANPELMWGWDHPCPSSQGRRPGSQGISGTIRGSSQEWGRVSPTLMKLEAQASQELQQNPRESKMIQKIQCPTM